MSEQSKMVKVTTPEFDCIYWRDGDVCFNSNQLTLKCSSKSCPLPDYDWKEKLFWWIDENQYSGMSESDYTNEMVVGIDSLRQKIKEL